MSADIGLIIKKSGGRVRLQEFGMSDGMLRTVMASFDTAEEALSFLEKRLDEDNYYEGIVVQGFEELKKPEEENGK